MLPVDCQPRPGSAFALGATPVACEAADAAGNVARAGFTVTVRDTTPPQLAHVPADLALTTGSAGGTPVMFPSPTANDLVDGAVPVTCDPAAGATFQLGTTSVTCSAVDARGNRAAATFAVTVTRLGDTTPPTLTLPGPLRVEATGPTGSSVAYRVRAVDSGRPVPVRCTPPSGSRFPLGETLVSCSATDAAGNIGTGSFRVTVVDTVAPRFTRVPHRIDVDATTPGGASVAYTLPRVQDRVDRHPTVDCTPPPGSVFAVGRTVVRCTVTDAGGNVARAAFDVTVHGAYDQLLELERAVLHHLGGTRDQRLKAVAGRPRNGSPPPRGCGRAHSLRRALRVCR